MIDFEGKNEGLFCYWKLQGICYSLTTDARLSHAILICISQESHADKQIIITH